MQLRLTMILEWYQRTAATEAALRAAGATSLMMRLDGCPDYNQVDRLQPWLEKLLDEFGSSQWVDIGEEGDRSRRHRVDSPPSALYVFFHQCDLMLTTPFLSTPPFINHEKVIANHVQASFPLAINSIGSEYDQKSADNRPIHPTTGHQHTLEAKSADVYPILPTTSHQQTMEAAHAT